MNPKPTPGEGAAGGQPGRPAQPGKAGKGGKPGRADLAELQATDALLDRLARGGETAEDRHDPLVEALAGLRASLDTPPEHASGEEISRLMDVLGDRPLYLVDDPTGTATPQDHPIRLGEDEIEGAGPEDRTGEAIELVDLTDPRLDADPAPTPDHPSDRDADDDENDRRGGEPHPGPVISLPMQRAGWQRVLAQAALPAASVALLVTLASGVSAVITGNVMSPVDGVSRVVSQLPGGPEQPTPKTVTSAQEAIVLAGRAAQAHQRQRAVTLLALAQKKVSQLPPAEQQRLNVQIAAVKKTLNTRTAPALPTPQDPGVVVKPTTTPPPPSSTSPTTTTSTTTTTPPTTTTASPTPTQSVATTPSATTSPSAPTEP